MRFASPDRSTRPKSGQRPLPLLSSTLLGTRQIIDGRIPSPYGLHSFLSYSLSASIMICRLIPNRLDLFPDSAFALRFASRARSLSLLNVRMLP
jgi:hypothetical protein